jgi:hypothetical protein
MATITPPYQGTGGIYFLYETRHRELLLLCVIYSLHSASAERCVKDKRQRENAM